MGYWRYQDWFRLYKGLNYNKESSSRNRVWSKEWKQTRTELLRALEREHTFFLARSFNPEQQS